MSPITTHILDLSTGRPASGVAISLAFQAADGRWEDLATGFTDADGRARNLLPEGTPIAAGIYRLRFETLAYFQRQGVSAFHPEVVVSFDVVDPSTHHHVPLLLSPYGYSTYRGS